MTDIRRLVERVAEALGSDATPERVEAVAAALLETTADNPGPIPSPTTQGPPFASPEPGERAILTA